MLAWFIPWYIIHIYRYDRFEAFRLKRFLQLELRSLMTLQLFLGLLFLFIYDIGSAGIKYWEGFWLNPETQEIVSKPATLWSKSHQEHVQPVYYILSLALAFQNCGIFLLQSWWHYITSPKKSFKTSFEFRIHILASFLALLTYPLLQYFLRDDLVMRESVPQLVYSTMLIFLAMLGVRTHFRLKRLMKSVIPDLNEHNFVLFNKLDYFADINKILMFTFSVVGIALGILSVDGLTERRVIAHNKFASDFLVCNLNFVQPIMWAALTLLLYPRKSDAHSYHRVSLNGAPIRVAPDSNLGQSFPRKSEQAGCRNSRGSTQAKDAHVQMEMTQGNFHDESADRASFIAYIPPTNPAPVVTNPTRPPRPRIETTTLYYHEGLVRQAREQLSPPPMPSSTDHLLKGVEVQQHDVNEHQDHVELSLLNGNEQGGGLIGDRSMTATESDVSADEETERRASRTRAKPDTQSLTLHYGPLYHQQYQAPAPLSPSSSSTTMASSSGSGGRVFPEGEDPNCSRQSAISTLKHQRQPSSERVRSESSATTKTAQPPRNSQPVVYLSSPLQYLQPYEPSYDPPTRPTPALTTVPASGDPRKRVSPPVPAREKRASDEGRNPFSLKIVSQQPTQTFGQPPLQEYQYQHHPHRPMSPMGWDEPHDSVIVSSDRYGRRSDPSVGQISVQL
ncbi:hypothetical protein DFQ27_009182 [Actinomortierella ambigua]|uniref:Uncharacterized protein n=1 Tax=Actinomortierella ambigua TaxID=1343610 RepID=A0A9P6UAT4_9FUNG|nr:hypothetical protein DFQ27_009182 [Actinomortierella ambigua]